jgi:uncharacterized protein
MRQSLEGSLCRLRRDRIDLLQLHGSSYGPDGEALVLRTGGMLLVWTAPDGINVPE